MNLLISGKNFQHQLAIISTRIKLVVKEQIDQALKINRKNLTWYQQNSDS